VALDDRLLIVAGVSWVRIGKIGARGGMPAIVEGR